MSKWTPWDYLFIIVFIVVSFLAIFVVEDMLFTTESYIGGMSENTRYCVYGPFSDLFPGVMFFLGAQISFIFSAAIVAHERKLEKKREAEDIKSYED